MPSLPVRPETWTSSAAPPSFSLCGSVSPGRCTTSRICLFFFFLTAVRSVVRLLDVLTMGWGPWMVAIAVIGAVSAGAWLVLAQRTQVS